MLKAAILILMLGITMPMYISFSQKPVCITVEDQPGKEVKFFYEVIGSNGTGHRVDFVPLTGGTISPFSFTSTKNQTSFSDTSMKICFVATENAHKSASIEYYTHDTAHIMELALKSEVFDLHSKLIDVGEQIKEVNKNEMFEESRLSVFADVVQSHESRLQKFAIVKIVVIAIVAVAQLYLLRVLLKNSGQGYQPV